MQTIRIKRTDVIRVRELLFKKQGGICPLCNRPIERTSGNVCLDHDHRHGHCRAALCRNCNGIEGKVLRWAGQAKRDGTELEWLKRLVEYWEVHAIPQTPFLHHLHKTEEQKQAAKKARAALKRKSRAQRLKELMNK